VRPRVVDAARALSDLFTTGRPEAFPDYFADADALAAYGLWFFPRTWSQVRYPLAEAVERTRWREAGASPAPALRVLDLGSGAGAAGLSAAWWLLEHGLASAVELTAVDRSSDALAALRRLAADVAPARGTVSVRTTVGDLRAAVETERRAAPFDLVVAAHAVNEAFAADGEAEEARWLSAVATLAAPTGLLLLVEPGLRATSLRLRRVVALASGGGAVFPWAPELSGKPWRPVETGRFWPHEVRPWSAPPRARAVARMLRRPEPDLTFSFALLGRTAPPPLEPSPRTFRMTSPFAGAKGRFQWTGLGADGSEHRFDLLRRAATAPDLARLRGVERGDVLHAETLVPSGEGSSWRVPSSAGLRVLWHPIRA
jgi:SAM-dependent methyltransferase